MPRLTQASDSDTTDTNNVANKAITQKQYIKKAQLQANTSIINKIQNIINVAVKKVKDVLNNRHIHIEQDIVKSTINNAQETLNGVQHAQNTIENFLSKQIKIYEFVKFSQ